jgi:hypothetical protein
MLARFLVSAFVLCALAGCAVETFGYAMSQYGDVRGVRVRLGCRDTYEVFDRTDRRSLVVVTNPLNEALARACADAAPLPRPDRMRRIAGIFLTETTARPQCVLGPERPLTEFHAEYEYRCPEPRPRR